MDDSGVLRAELIRPTRETVVVEVHGEVDVYTAPQLRDALTAALDAGPRRLIADLGKVTFVDPTGLGVLVEAANRLRAIGLRLELAGVHENILELLRITALDRVFVVHPSRETALASSPS